MFFVRRVEVRVVAGELFHEEVVGRGGQAELLAGPAIGFHGLKDAGAADGGVPDPFHELEVELFGGFLFVAFEAGFLDLDTAVVKVAAMQAGDVMGDEAEFLSMLLKFLRGFFVAVHHKVGVIEGEDAEEGIGGAFGGIGQVFSISGQFALVFEELAVMEPVAIAA